MFEFILRRHIPDWALQQYREGSLDQKRSEALEGHLLLCPTCQMQMEDLLPPAKLGPFQFGVGVGNMSGGSAQCKRQRNHRVDRAAIGSGPPKLRV